MDDLENALLGIQIMLWIFIAITGVIYKKTKSETVIWIGFIEILFAIIDLGVLIKLNY